MIKEISSLRIQKAIKANAVDTMEFGKVKAVDTIEFGGFMNAIFEYIFTRKDRGLVDNVVIYQPVESSSGVYDRVARVHVKVGKKRCYFYVFTSAIVGNLHSWNVVASTVLMEGAIRVPDYEKEMIFFWETL